MIGVHRESSSSNVDKFNSDFYTIWRNYRSVPEEMQSVELMVLNWYPIVVSEPSYLSLKGATQTLFGEALVSKYI